MAKSQENSVLFALEELRQLESDRQAEDVRRRAAAAEARRAAMRAEAERVEAERLQAERVAEAEARLRVQAELSMRDAEAEQRVASLRAQLAAVEADRELSHQSVLSVADPRPDTSHAGRGWFVGFALSAATATALAALLLLRPAPAPRIIEVPVASAPTTVVEAPEAAAPAPEVAVSAPEPEVTAPVLPRTRPRVRPPHGDHTDQVFQDLDRCGDDPTCGLSMR